MKRYGRKLSDIFTGGGRSVAAIAFVMALGVLRADAFRADRPVDRRVPPEKLEAAAVCRQPSIAQQNAADLAQRSGLNVSWNSVLGTPSRIRGADLTTRGLFSPGRSLKVGAAAASARDALGVLHNLSALFEIKDAAREFSATAPIGDRLGFRHVRLHQMHRGLSVVGGEMRVHFDANGRAYEVGGRYVAGLTLDTKPTLSDVDATQHGLLDLVEQGKPDARVLSPPQVVVLALGREPELAYRVVFGFDDPKRREERWQYLVSARDGRVLLRLNEIRKIAAPTTNGSDSPVTGTILAGEGGGNVSVTGWYENTGVYYLWSKPWRWYVFNVATGGYTDSNTYAYRTTSNWGTSDRAEMSTARNFELTQAYFFDVHGRDSFNDAGAYARANVHEGVNYVNAYWDGFSFYFGDGDGVMANQLCILDVTAHEFTHAVTQYSADLFYESDSGALNESFSDIFGACVEFDGQPDGRAFYPGSSPGTADWLMGEDCWLATEALRDMRNPRNTATVGAGYEQPSRYHGTYWYYGTGDNGGVHINSGVQNFLFYVLAEGGTGDNDGIAYDVTGIGIPNAGQVAYRALTTYCGMYTDYEAARLAWVSAAADLNTNWVPSVEAAWAAVGIGPTVDTPTFVPPGGIFTSAVDVVIATSTDGATIHYTLDGGEPTQSSAVYTSAIPVSAETTIKAKAYKAGEDPSATAEAQYLFLSTRFYRFSMDTAPGWTTQGQWVFGQPQGGGGAYGPPDPTSGFTGNNVYGYNLAGDYANNISGTHWLTTSALNLSLASGATLGFRRWLGVEQPAYDHAYVEVSNNGSTWTRVWANSVEVTDAEWTYVIYDVSSIADQQSTVYVRWGIGPTDGGWTYCGWNIDDVEIWGEPVSPEPPSAPDGLQANAVSSSRVQLTWNDTSSNEQGFSIERKTGNGPWSPIATVGPNVTTHPDDTVTPETTYSYRVRAFNVYGDSGYTAEESVTTPESEADAWDPTDNTVSGATRLAPPRPKLLTHGPHRISAQDTFDWFAFYLNAGINYNFNSVGGTGDLVADLYRTAPYLHVVASDDNSGGGGQFSLTYRAQATGWHYLLTRPRVNGSFGAYDLKYKALDGPFGYSRIPVSLPDHRVTVMVVDQDSGTYTVNEQRQGISEVIVPGMLPNRWYYVAVWDDTAGQWAFTEWTGRHD